MMRTGSDDVTAFAPNIDARAHGIRAAAPAPARVQVNVPATGAAADKKRVTELAEPFLKCLEGTNAASSRVGVDDEELASRACLHEEVRARTATPPALDLRGIGRGGRPVFLKEGMLSRPQASGVKATAPALMVDLKGGRDANAKRRKV